MNKNTNSHLTLTRLLTHANNQEKKKKAKRKKEIEKRAAAAKQREKEDAAAGASSGAGAGGKLTSPALKALARKNRRLSPNKRQGNANEDATEKTKGKSAKLQMQYRQQQGGQEEGGLMEEENRLKLELGEVSKLKIALMRLRHGKPASSSDSGNSNNSNNDDNENSNKNSSAGKQKVGGNGSEGVASLVPPAWPGGDRMQLDVLVAIRGHSCDQGS